MQDLRINTRSRRDHLINAEFLLGEVSKTYEFNIINEWQKHEKPVWNEIIKYIDLHSNSISEELLNRRIRIIYKEYFFKFLRSMYLGKLDEFAVNPIIEFESCPA